jgi:hypothetical protein
MNLILISPFNKQIYQETICFFGARMLGPLLQYEQFKSVFTVSKLLHSLDIYYIVGRDFLFPVDKVLCPVLSPSR